MTKPKKQFVGLFVLTEVEALEGDGVSTALGALGLPWVNNPFCDYTFTGELNGRDVTARIISVQPLMVAGSQ